MFTYWLENEAKSDTGAVWSRAVLSE